MAKTIEYRHLPGLKERILHHNERNLLVVLHRGVDLYVQRTQETEVIGYIRNYRIREENGVDISVVSPVTEGSVEGDLVRNFLKNKRFPNPRLKS
ncbi:MAG: hypothetical protein ABIH49_00685 [archaeon]